MKTRLEWLEMLPDGYRELAIANARCINRNLEIKETSLQHAITNSIHWASTPEGSQFWVDIYYSSKGKIPTADSFPMLTKKMRQRIETLQTRLSLPKGVEITEDLT